MLAWVLFEMQITLIRNDLELAVTPVSSSALKQFRSVGLFVHKAGQENAVVLSAGSALQLLQPFVICRDQKQSIASISTAKYINVVTDRGLELGRCKGATGFSFRGIRTQIAIKDGRAYLSQKTDKQLEYDITGATVFRVDDACIFLEYSKKSVSINAIASILCLQIERIEPKESLTLVCT